MGVPPPLLYAPLDGMDDDVFCVSLRPNEEAASAAARVEALVDDARKAAPTRSDIALVEAGFGRLFGLGDPAAMAENPYLAALSAARLAEWNLRPTALRATLNEVTADSLKRVLVPEGRGYGGVLATLKRK